jgi:hypothetical protein
VGRSEAQQTKFWAADVGNYWDYCEGSSGTWISRYANSGIDSATFSFPTYLATTYSVMGNDLAPLGQEWFTINEISTTASEMIVWQMMEYDDVVQSFLKYTLNSGVTWAKRPIIVGDSWVSSTSGFFNDTTPIDVTVNSSVLAYESVTVPFGTFNAYKIHHVIQVAGLGPLVKELTRTFWIIPYFGDVKKETAEVDFTLTESLCGMDISTVFSDVFYDYWAYPYVMKVLDAGLTAGCAAGRYCPEDVVTREQMAVFLLKALNDVPGDGYCGGIAPFSDVSANRWSCKYIKRLVERGITAGIGPGLFGPEGPVTREQMAVFITKALGQAPADGYCGTTDPFLDVPYGSWSCKYVKKLVELEITAGIGQGLFGPGNNVTRAQMAVFLSKAFLTSETPPISALEMTNAVLPLEFKKIPLNTGGVPISNVKQTSGPSVSNLMHDNGVFSFVAPAETGKDEMLTFLIVKSDNTSIIYKIKMPTLLSPTVTAEINQGEGPSAVIRSDLSLSVPSLTNVKILPVNFTDFSLVFSSPTGSKISGLNIDLFNGIAAYEVTDYFDIDQQTGVVSLKAANKSNFVTKLSDQIIELFVSGVDNRNLTFSYGISFYYGSNIINGKLVDQLGNTLTSLSGKLIVLRGFTSRIKQSSIVSAAGTFSFSNVVTDNYSLSLVDPSGQHFGTSLFLIPAGGSTVSVNLVVFASTIVSTLQKVFVTHENEVRIEENKDIPEFQKNKHIEERSITEAASILLKPLVAPPENTVLVSGAAKDVTIQGNKQIWVPKETTLVKIVAEVTTKEYPNYTTKDNNPYNDSWQYSYSCGYEKGDVAGLVNQTHSATGLRIYEKEIDVTSLTILTGITCTIGAATTNIGDGLLATTVKISLEPSSGIGIDKVVHWKGLYRDNSTGGNLLYNMSVPLASGKTIYGNRPWSIYVFYFPIDAEITNMKIELAYNGKNYLLGDYIDFTKVEDGVLFKDDIIVEAQPLQPAGNQTANVFVTLAGKVEGNSFTSKPRAMQFDTEEDSFVPLFEVRNYYDFGDSLELRYGGPANDPREDKKGGDGWARGDMLIWLGGGGDFLKYNDISGANAWQDAAGKSLGAHSAHKGGYEIDARYYDENGEFKTVMCGQSAYINDVLVGGYYIKQMVETAEAEVEQGKDPKPNWDKLKKWVDYNRLLLAQLASDDLIQLIFIGKEDWFWEPLMLGKIKELDLGVGAYVQDPKKKVIGYPDHESHMHIRFNP